MYKQRYKGPMHVQSRAISKQAAHHLARHAACMGWIAADGAQSQYFVAANAALGVTLTLILAGRQHPS